MENVFFELRLDEFWEHPDNRGWTTLFGMWAKSPTFCAAWERSCNTFGIRFGYFCHQRLGLADPEAPQVQGERRRQQKMPRKGRKKTKEATDGQEEAPKP